MKRVAKKIVIGLSALAFAFSSFSCGSGSLEHTVKLGDNGDLITNKGMGWNFCYYSNSLVKFGANLTSGDLLDYYPCDIVYFRIGWNFIQPDKEFAKAMGWTDESKKTQNGIYVTEDECTGDYFHWDLIDPIVEEWTAAGKRVAFRITANDGWGQCTPLWVRDLGAQGVEYDTITEGSYDKLTNLMEVQCTCGVIFDAAYETDGKYTCTSCGEKAEEKVPEVRKKKEKEIVDGIENEIEKDVVDVKCDHCDKTFEAEYKTDAKYACKTCGNEVTFLAAKKKEDSDGNYVYTEESMETVYNGFTTEGKTWYDSGENGHVLGAGRKTWCPDWGDEIFLNAYKNMLYALKERYGDVLEFVEIGSFGTWGEGHFNRAKPTEKWVTGVVGRANVLKHFQIHKDVFGDDVLVIAGDTMAERLGVSDEIVSYGFGCTDDSVQVPGMSGNANSAILKPLYDAGAVTALETHPGTVSTEQYYDGVNDCCASYARLIANPEEMKASEWTDMITKRLGYRFTFTEAKLSNFTAGETFEARLSLKNTGAAKCRFDGYPAIVVLSENGKEICSGVSKFNVKNLAIESDPEKLDELAATNVTVKVDVPKGLSAGRYSICVCVVDENGDAAFNLPLDDGYNMLYRIATFEVK